MQLKSFSYLEWEGTSQEWLLGDFLIGQKNLLVGKNASGKSRTLNVIAALAKALTGAPALRSGKFGAEFKSNESTYNYSCHYVNEKVIAEKLLIDGKLHLSRVEGGIGEILVTETGLLQKFQAPPSELAVVVRRDTIQHAYLEPLYEWASSVRHYHFGTPLGQKNLSVIQGGNVKVDERDESAVVGIFKEGLRKFGNFESTIISDMEMIGYNLETVELSSPLTVSLRDIPVEPVSLNVKEKDLLGITDQFSMSQGMFRALAILIHVNYFNMKGAPICVLVDDIGEGLDFERSCSLIELLRNKADNSKIQVIMSTNDRYVMNKVPLEEWSVLQRKGNHVEVKNDKNSHEQFEEFKFTGLSNFSFLEFDYINEVVEE